MTTKEDNDQNVAIGKLQVKIEELEKDNVKNFKQHEIFYATRLKLYAITGGVSITYAVLKILKVI